MRIQIGDTQGQGLPRRCIGRCDWFFKTFVLTIHKLPSGTHERTAARFENRHLWAHKIPLQVRAEPLYSNSLAVVCARLERRDCGDGNGGFHMDSDSACLKRRKILQGCKRE